MQPAEITSFLEGLIGNQLRLTADTANNVAQAAQRWLDAVKLEMKRLDAAADVFVQGFDMSAAAASINVTTDANARVFAAIVRNNTAASEMLKIFGSVAATVVPTGDASATNLALIMTTVPVATRVAANSPAYGFGYWPGGLDATQIGTAGVSLFVSPTAGGATTGAADATAWIVWQE